MSASKFPTKPTNPIWQHFYIVQQGPTLLLSTAKCEYCTWEHLGHSGKMEAHLAKCLGFSELKAKSDLKCVEHGDHRFRGRLLSPSNRRKATSLLLSLYKPEDGDAVLAELERFEKGTGLFSSDLVHKDMFPMTFWKRVFPDSVLASQAAVYCSLPATSASVERVWSAAAYQTQGRERLTTEHLFRELYVKMNS